MKFESQKTKDVIKRALQERINRLTKIKERIENEIKNREAGMGETTTMDAGGGFGVSIPGDAEMDKKIIKERKEKLDIVSQKLNEYTEALETLKNYKW